MRAVTILFAASLVAGCARGGADADKIALLQSKVDALEARVKALEAGSTGERPSHVTLTETWLTPGQPPSTTNADFTSHDTCENARQQALAQAAAAADARRAQQDRDAAASGSVIVAHAEAPTLQAVCSE